MQAAKWTCPCKVQWVLSSPGDVAPARLQRTQWKRRPWARCSCLSAAQLAHSSLDLGSVSSLGLMLWKQDAGAKRSSSYIAGRVKTGGPALTTIGYGREKYSSPVLCCPSRWKTAKILNEDRKILNEILRAYMRVKQYFLDTLREDKRTKGILAPKGREKRNVLPRIQP